MKIGAPARNKIKEENQDLSYDDQCNMCEKVTCVLMIDVLFNYV